MSRILALTRDLRLVPGGAAQPIERRRGFAGAAILLDQVHARQRHVELGFAGVFEQHEIALLLALRDLANAEKLSDAVRGVDHEIAGLQIGESAANAASWDLGG